MDCAGPFPNRPAKGGGPRLLAGLGPSPGRNRGRTVIGKVSHVKCVGKKNGTL